MSVTSACGACTRSYIYLPTLCRCRSQCAAAAGTIEKLLEENVSLVERLNGQTEKLSRQKDEISKLKDAVVAAGRFVEAAGG
jgi:hypothetical protein